VLSYDVVDVFTDRPFAGNPLAVVHGAEALDDHQLLAIAREFNLSETTFPAAPDEDGRGYTVRIFTPGGEIPFAGHPTLGTAWVLQQHGRVTAGTVVQRCGAGDIEVLLPEDFDAPVRLRAAPRDLTGPLDAAPLAEVVGLAPDAVAGEARIAGCGLNWVHLPVTGDSLGRCRPDAQMHAVWRHDDLRDPVAGVNVYALTDDDPDGLSVRSRVFCPDVGVVEDPATGSAAVGLGMALVAADVLPEGGGYTIRQGVEMGRPSTLYARVDAEAGQATRCEVGGGVVSAAAGTIAIPAG
jgi:trans-2,3-dihydro-3-hydroxyanthranilate isomerase